MTYQNKISILRNILKNSDNKNLTDHVSKQILPETYTFYKENRNKQIIIYNIDNCYKLYYKNLYDELSKIYKLTTLDKLIFRKKYDRLNYIIKLLKDKNIILDDYKNEAQKIFLFDNIKNYSMWIDNNYLDENRQIKKCLDCNKYHIDCKKSL